MGIISLFSIFVLFTSIIGFTRSIRILPFQINGSSMEPAFKNEDYVLFNQFDKNFQRNEIIIFIEQGDFIISRIISLPNEKIEIKNGKIYINNQLIDEPESAGKTNILLGPDEYFVISDDRSQISGDSRVYGPINKDNIIATFVQKLTE